MHTRTHAAQPYSLQRSIDEPVVAHSHPHCLRLFDTRAPHSEVGQVEEDHVWGFGDFALNSTHLYVATDSDLVVYDRRRLYPSLACHKQADTAAVALHAAQPSLVWLGTYSGPPPRRCAHTRHALRLGGKCAASWMRFRPACGEFLRAETLPSR